ncbi:MAG TPA: Ig-like domain-containing protein [Clostridiales bacterium]|mgnify:CR=1 FL=1|nr:Ig-like domain-containing protein [Clostridiales bacterium]
MGKFKLGNFTRRNILTYLLVFIFLFVNLSQIVTSAQNVIQYENKFYVSINGDNNNDGSIESPFRTITHALAVIPSNSELVIRGGTYTDEAAVLSGKSGIVIENYDNEIVSIINQAEKYFSVSKCSDITIKGINIAYSGGRSKNTLIVSDSSNINISHVHSTGGDVLLFKVDTFKLYSSTFSAAQGDSGATVRDTKNGKVYNNIVYNNTNYGIYVLGNSSNNSIYNNTLFNNAKGDIYILSHPTLGTPQNNRICNNIITRGLYLLSMNEADIVGLNQFNYNAYNENLAGNIGIISPTHPDGISFTDFKALPSAPEQNAVIGNISFIDSSINDFRLKGDSICIGNGTPADAPTHDYRGLERITGVDIGAYQFSEDDIFRLAIVSYSPQGQSNGIDVPVVVSFNNNISADNIDGLIKVVDPQGNEISGSISVEGKTITFTISAFLEYETKYSVTVDGNIKDIDGNVLGAPFSWEFNKSRKWTIKLARDRH